MANNKNRQPNEIDVLNQMNNMNTMEFQAFRFKNEEHEQMIAKRTIRNPISKFIKRTIDIFAGIIGVVLLIPICVLVIAMRLINGEKGSLFYNQERIGFEGKIFYIHKFRSMVPDAEQILEKYLSENPDEAEQYTLYKKLNNDPRITKTGKFLRMTSLDEWPQFIDILIGRMSLVGPRPYLVAEKEDMGEHYKYIVSVKPGLTGPWQIAGRSKLSFEDRLLLDEEYASRCGNRRDIRIIFKTFGKVFSKEGAI